MKKPNDIVDEMMSNDLFSRWLGVEVLEIGEGYSKLKMVVRKEMLNGFGIAHGGISYSFADSALAFASNSRGTHAVSIETSISHTKPAMEGDELIAIAKEENLTNKVGIYTISVTNQNEHVVALFKGTVYRTGKEW